VYFTIFIGRKLKKLVLELAKRFPKGTLVFDSVRKIGLKLMMKKVLKNMKIDNVEGYFYMDNPKELDWSDKIVVSSKGYMLGYYDMKSPGIHFWHRFLARLADKKMKMAVTCLKFK